MISAHYFDMSVVFAQINWVWLAFSIVAAFAVGAIWYSLIFFNTWRSVFKVDMPDQNKPGGWVRSFIIQLVTGSMFGLVCFVAAALSVNFAILTVLTIAGWQMCTITFKYGDWKRFLQAVMIESGYTLVSGAIYIIFAQF